MVVLTSQPVDDDPPWLTQAMGTAGERATQAVDGAEVALRSWRTDDLPGVLLVHGGAAHARWWDHVLPCLGERRVVSMDLTGHGDSAWRPDYSYAGWAEEIAAVALRRFARPPVVVGHSLGGIAALIAAAKPRPAFAAVLVVDSPLSDLAQIPTDGPNGMAGRPRRDRAELTRRFRPLHASGRESPEVVAYVAEHSVRLGDDGYRWKFDPSFRYAPRAAHVVPHQAHCPLVYVRCEDGLSTPEMFVAARARPGGDRLEVVTLTGAGHNPMLEPPDLLAELLCAQMERFEP
jgi:pimeloyl-ACP methyl ester carboxylesterase